MKYAISLTLVNIDECDLPMRIAEIKYIVGSSNAKVHLTITPQDDENVDFKEEL